MKGFELPEERKANPLGIKFLSADKRKDLITVVDVLSTVNSKGDIVRKVLLCEHECNGQVVKSELPISALMRADIV